MIYSHRTSKFCHSFAFPGFIQNQKNFIFFQTPSAKQQGISEKEEIEKAATFQGARRGARNG